MSRGASLLLGTALALAACVGSRRAIVRPPAAPAPTAPPAAERAGRPDSARAPDLVKQGVFAPLGSLFDSPGLVRGLMGMRVEAYNVTAEDDVADAGWFERRDRPSAAAVGRGPGGEPPDTATPWTLVAARRGGRAAVTIRDGWGRQYWLTFDAPEHPELATAAEVIAARLFWAAGYHVPETYLVVFDPARRLAAVDTGGLFARVARQPDGRVRAVAHRVPGRAVGSFAFSGRRGDDPADTVPHEHRRELRGLYVVAGWLNHTDLYRGNTLDVIVDSAGRAWVRHYVLGLESSLGSRGGRPKTTRAGSEADWDAPRIAARLFSLGFYSAAWERSGGGRFDPGRWTPTYPNPAFGRRTVRDGYWGAKLVARITESEIGAAVGAAQLGDTAEAEAVVRTLVEHRALTVRHWFARVTPLEELVIERGSGGPSLAFRDLVVAEGLASARGRRYAVRLELRAAGLKHRETVALDLSADGRGVLALPVPVQTSDAWAAVEAWPVERRVGWLDVRAIRGPGEPERRAVRIYLLADRGAGYRIVGRRY